MNWLASAGIALLACTPAAFGVWRTWRWQSAETERVRREADEEIAALRASRERGDAA